MFTVEVDEEFLDYVTDGSLAIEIYGNRSRGYDTKPSPLQLPQEDGNKSLVDRLVKQIIPYSHLVLFFNSFWYQIKSWSQIESEKNILKKT